MQTVGLTWQHSLETATVLLAVGGLASLPGNKYVRWGGALLRETAIIGALYGVWQYAGGLAHDNPSGAYRRAEHIRHWERFLPLPSEETVQHIFLRFGDLVQFANLYYATMHFTMMFVFLLWVFIRHREHYRPIRQVLAWTTLACLLVQFVSVAPPRMLPGITDTAMKYGQSVYNNGLAADQLSAMPSVHVAWAVLVGWYTWHVTTSKWRVVGAVHTTLTIFFVVLTGNHWWSDGIVATLLLVASAWFVRGYRSAWQSWRARSGALHLPEPASLR